MPSGAGNIILNGSLEGGRNCIENEKDMLSGAGNIILNAFFKGGRRIAPKMKKIGRADLETLY